jgi:hypothetical protein
MWICGQMLRVVRLISSELKLVMMSLTVVKLVRIQLVGVPRGQICSRVDGQSHLICVMDQLLVQTRTGLGIPMVSTTLEVEVDLITQVMMMLMTRRWQNEATQKMDPSLPMEAGQDGGGFQGRVLAMDTQGPHPGGMQTDLMGTIILTHICFLHPGVPK